MAIRDHRSISDETKRRVWDAQMRLGYSLRQRRVKRNGSQESALKNIAFILVDRTFQDSAYSHVFQGIATASVEKEVNPIYLSLRYEELIKGQMPSILRNREVEGLIVSGNYDIRIHEIFDRLGLPLVVVGNYRLVGRSVASCESDMDDGIAQMMAHFHELGHRRVGIIQNTLGTWFEQQILHCFKTEANRYKFDSAGHLHQVISEAGSAAAAATAMLSLKQRATAIFVTDEHSVVEVYDAAARLKLEIPDHLSLGVLGVTEKLARRSPLTTTEVDSQRIGREALNKLNRLATDHGSCRSRELFPMRFVKGRSTAPAPSK
jgi:DNA-binding LacI/PurR family transcriptional regulator